MLRWGYLSWAFLGLFCVRGFGAESGSANVSDPHHLLSPRALVLLEQWTEDCHPPLKIRVFLEQDSPMETLVKEVERQAAEGQTSSLIVFGYSLQARKFVYDLSPGLKSQVHEADLASTFQEAMKNPPIKDNLDFLILPVVLKTSSAIWQNRLQGMRTKKETAIQQIFLWQIACAAAGLIAFSLGIWIFVRPPNKPGLGVPPPGGTYRFKKRRSETESAEDESEEENV
jgi:hypothetical protein